MPFTLCWICATRDDLSLSILQLHTRWPIPPSDCRVGGTDMWRAWIGFNFSHSLGVLLFGALEVWAGSRIKTLPVGIMPALTPDRLRLSGSRPALLVSDSCHRHCHWYRLLGPRPVVSVIEAILRQLSEPLNTVLSRP